MRVLVIGGSGYVGPLVPAALRASDPDVFVAGIDAGWFLAQNDGVGPLPEVYYDNFRLGDARDVRLQDLNAYDVILYLAAISNDPMGNRFADLTREINEEQAVRIARLAREAECATFVMASSASVYGRGQGPRTEASSLDPQTDYARSKVNAEDRLQGLADERFRVICLRFATACGWSPRIRLDLVLNDFVASALTTSRIEVLSDGTPWRPLIHVKDMARAFAWSVGQSSIEGYEPFMAVNVGSDGWNFQIRDLASAVAHTMQGVEVAINTSAAPDTRSYSLDFSKWREVAPSHQPTVSLDEAIHEISSNLSRLPDLHVNFRDSSRMRLKHLEGLLGSQVLSEDLRWIRA